MHVVIGIATAYAIGTEFSRRSRRAWLRCAGDSPLIALTGKLLPLFALFFALLGIEALILHAGFELAYRSSVLMMCFSAMLFILAYQSLAALLTLLVRNLALGLSLVAIIASPALGYAGVGLPVPATNRFAKAWGASQAMRWYQLLLFGRSAANVFTVTPAYSALRIRPHRRRRAHLKKLTGSPDGYVGCQAPYPRSRLTFDESPLRESRTVGSVAGC